MIYATVDSESTMTTRHALPSLPSCLEKDKQSITCHHHQVIHTDIGEIYINITVYVNITMTV